MQHLLPLLVLLQEPDPDIPDIELHDLIEPHVVDGQVGRA